MALLIQNVCQEAYNLTRDGNAQGVLALLAAGVVDPRTGRIVTVAEKCKESVICGVLTARYNCCPRHVDDALRALMLYRSADGTMFTFKQGPPSSLSKSQFSLVWGVDRVVKHFVASDFRALDDFGERWTLENRWSPGRAAWAAAVVICCR